jgi:hypothetical protein
MPPTKKAAAKKTTSSSGNDNKGDAPELGTTEDPKTGDSVEVTSPASAAGVTPSEPVTEGAPAKQDGPESLVAKGIREHEEAVAELREKGGQDYPNVNVEVQYPTPAPPDAVESELEEREFAYVHHLDPQRKLPGTSPYLDDVNRMNEEVQRAKVEGRKPDLKNPPTTQGTPLPKGSTVTLEVAVEKVD